MSIGTHNSTHPVLACVRTIDEALTGVADVQPGYMSVEDKKAALLELERLIARAFELQLRVLAESDDVAASEGMRDPAAWLGHHAHLDPRDARRRQRLARDLNAHPEAAEALRAGSADVVQVETVLRAVGELPDDVDAGVRGLAEKHLLAQATAFMPHDLRILGRRVLDVVAPAVAEEHERRLLENEEAHAERAATLRTRVNGDGTTDVHARVPDHAAHRLMSYLEAYTSPRHDSGSETNEDRRPYGQQLGHAFVAFLEHADPERLPLHGGDATTVVVTIDYDTLVDVTAARVAHVGDQPVSPGHARRLACTAGIVPAVLGGGSQVLDLGRTRRLYTPPQRKAMAIRDQTCRAEGCDIPATWCEAHHLRPWSQGGGTDLDDGVLLCSHHHHRIHDHRYTSQRGPDRRIRFLRR